MTGPLIWLHEEALRATHPVFHKAPDGARAVFIWDDRYLQKLDYSLKRLVFIYETVCELPVDVIQGDIVEIIKEIAPSRLYVPASNKSYLLAVFNDLKSVVDLEIIRDEDFVNLPGTADIKRFFKYWSVAEKNAFLQNGGLDA